MKTDLCPSGATREGRACRAGGWTSRDTLGRRASGHPWESEWEGVARHPDQPEQSCLHCPLQNVHINMVINTSNVLKQLQIILTLLVTVKIHDLLQMNCNCIVPINTENIKAFTL